jgi:hypothetical protein
LLGGIPAEVGKFAFQLMRLMTAEGYDLLASSTVNFAMGLAALRVDLGRMIINAMATFLQSYATSVLYRLCNILFEIGEKAQLMFRGIVDDLEVTFDFMTGAFALAKYFGWNGI